MKNNVAIRFLDFPRDTLLWSAKLGKLKMNVINMKLITILLRIPFDNTLRKTFVYKMENPSFCGSVSTALQHN